MAGRPKSTDTEVDILMSQENFLHSGKKPSAQIKLLAGEKRKVKELVPGSMGEEEKVGGSSRRDVVTLSTEGSRCCTIFFLMFKVHLQGSPKSKNQGSGRERKRLSR